MAFPPVPPSGGLAFCCLGTNPPPAMAALKSNRRRRQSSLFASLGAVYIFNRAIGPDIMARIAKRGAGESEINIY